MLLKLQCTNFNTILKEHFFIQFQWVASLQDFLNALALCDSAFSNVGMFLKESFINESFLLKT